MEFKEKEINTKTEGILKFSPDFEEKIVQAILGDSIFGEQIMEVLEPQFFDLKYTQELAKILIEYYSKYENFPSVSLLKTVCREQINNPLILRECSSYIDKMQKRPLNGDSGYVKEQALRFFRTQ